jgi:hypothetical protein
LIRADIVGQSRAIMPEDPLTEATALITEARDWIKNTRRFANGVKDDDIRTALGKLYDIAEKQNRALEFLKKANR